MYKTYLPLLTIVAFAASCGEKEAVQKEEAGFVSKSVSKVASTASSLKAAVIEPDSVKEERKFAFVKKMTAAHPEYPAILKFFKTPSPFLLEKEGTIYRVNDLKITDEGTVIYRHDDDPYEELYLYYADKNYYVYTFDVKEKAKPTCSNIRRFKKGSGSQPVHDLMFENGRLVKEEFVADVSRDFFDKNGIQYFEVTKKFEDGEVINLYNLGPVMNF